MPNWCYNRMRVSSIHGDYNEIVDFLEKITNEKGLTFAKLIPMPDELANTQSPSRDTPERQAYLKEKYGAVDWYDWRLNNWGCKWDCQSDDIPTVADIKEDKDDWIEFTFDSPWSPPTKWFEKLCETFPTLFISMKYEEEGCDYFGEIRNCNGKAEDQYVQW